MSTLLPISNRGDELKDLRLLLAYCVDLLGGSLTLTPSDLNALRYSDLDLAMEQMRDPAALVLVAYRQERNPFL